MFLYIILSHLQRIQLGKQWFSHNKIYFWRPQSFCQIFPCFPQLIYWNCLKAENKKGNPVSETFPLFKHNLHFNYWWAVKAPTLMVVVFCEVWASDFSVIITSQEGKGHSYLAQLLPVSVGIADSFPSDLSGIHDVDFSILELAKKYRSNV